MSARLEAFLAKIYVDTEARVKFLADPRKAATDAGLNPQEVDSMEKIDRAGLEMTAKSLAKKRQHRH